MCEVDSLDQVLDMADNESLEPRVAKLEDAMQQLQTDVAVIKSNYVTKEDLHREIGGLRGELLRAINEQTWKMLTWSTGIGTAMIAATFFIARNVHP